MDTAELTGKNAKRCKIPAQKVPAHSLRLIAGMNTTSVDILQNAVKEKRARRCAITHQPPLKHLDPCVGALKGNFGPVALQDRKSQSAKKKNNKIN